jgi:predicted nucleotide-binding protein
VIPVFLAFNDPVTQFLSEDEEKMQLVPRKKALSLLNKTLDELDAITMTFHPDETEWIKWCRQVIVRVEAIFGPSSKRVLEIKEPIDELLAAAPDHKKEKVKTVVALIKSIISEVDQWTNETAPKPAGSTTHRVFIIHGHDTDRLQSVARFVEHLGLDVVIFHQDPRRLVIEKPEHESRANFAIVLLTPDDVGAAADDQRNLRPRARQNVVMELGYFMAKLGRTNVCALLGEGVEIPNDYSGVIYIHLDRSEAWKLLLAREMKSAGLPVDINKAI